jgi:hypothetical protein
MYWKKGLCMRDVLEEIALYERCTGRKSFV